MKATRQIVSQFSFVIYLTTLPFSIFFFFMNISKGNRKRKEKFACDFLPLILLFNFFLFILANAHCAFLCTIIFATRLQVRKLFRKKKNNNNSCLCYVNEHIVNCDTNSIFSAIDNNFQFRFMCFGVWENRAGVIYKNTEREKEKQFGDMNISQQ